MDTKMVANTPIHNPDALKAAGMDKIPVPKDDFNRWVSVPPLLNTKQYNESSCC